MNDELKQFLNKNKHLIEQEDYQLLQEACPGEYKKELRLFLLDCANNDTSIIYQSSLARVLQEEINKFTSNIFVIHLIMYQPHRYEGDRYVGDFAYTILMNNEIIDDVFEYNVVTSNFPRASAILEQVAEKFVGCLRGTK